MVLVNMPSLTWAFVTKRSSKLWKMSNKNLQNKIQFRAKWMLQTPRITNGSRRSHYEIETMCYANGTTKTNIFTRRFHSVVGQCAVSTIYCWPQNYNWFKIKFFKNISKCVWEIFENVCDIKTENMMWVQRLEWRSSNKKFNYELKLCWDTQNLKCLLNAVSAHHMFAGFLHRRECVKKRFTTVNSLLYPTNEKVVHERVLSTMEPLLNNLRHMQTCLTISKHAYICVSWWETWNYKIV